MRLTTPYLLSATVLLSFTLMTGCGSDSSSGDTDSKYKGIWSMTDNSNFIKVSSQGEITIYTCNFTEGYQTDGKVVGSITDNTMTNSTDPTLSATITPSADLTEFSYQLKGTKFTLRKVEQLPEVCTSDGIKITQITPDTATEGEKTTFSVSFTYQLESSPAAVIITGFTIKDANSFVQTDDQFEINSKGLRTGNMTVTGTPLIFADKKPFQLHLVMQKAEDQGKSTIVSIAGAEATIKVTPKL